MKPEVDEQLNKVGELPMCDLMEKPPIVFTWSNESSVVTIMSVFAPYFSLALSDRLAFGESKLSSSKYVCISGTLIFLSPALTDLIAS